MVSRQLNAQINQSPHMFGRKSNIFYFLTYHLCVPRANNVKGLGRTLTRWALLRRLRRRSCTRVMCYRCDIFFLTIDSGCNSPHTVFLCSFIVGEQFSDRGVLPTGEARPFRIAPRPRNLTSPPQDPLIASNRSATSRSVQSGY